MKIILKNAIKRKVNWLYYIDGEGNLCGYNLKLAWANAKKRLKKTQKEGVK